MKLVYVANQRLPTERAYGIQIAKMCEALADSSETVLIAPYRSNNIKESFFDYYSIKKNFRFKKIFSPDLYLPGKLDRFAFYVKNLISGAVLAVYTLGQKPDIIYSRDELPLFFLSFFKKNLVYETHNFSKKRSLFYRCLKKNRIKIVVISRGLKNEFEKIGFRPENILVAPDGVDLEKFDIDISNKEARRKVGLAEESKIALYAGSLYDWKGVDVFIDSGNFLPDVQLVVVGASKNEVKERIIFVEKKPQRQIPFYLKAADVLVLPNPAILKISEFYTSPLKLFEYMASRRPIVASGLPSIKEILNEGNAILVEPSSPKALGEGIKTVLENSELAEKISTKAFQDVQKYTWQKRANTILDYIS